MKIGFFTDTYFPQVNGVTYTIDLWKREFEKIYGKENVLVFYPKSEYKGSSNEISLPSVKFPLYETYKIAFPSLKLLKLNKLDLDLVHIHGLYSSAIFGIFTAKRLKIPCIITYHTPTHLYIHYATNLIACYFSKSTAKKISGYLQKGLMKWEKFILNSCDLITVPSNTIAAYLKVYNIDNRKIRVVSNGIDINLFKEDKKQRMLQKEKNKRCIGYCGRLGYEKKIEDLINLGKKFKGEILIGGEGPAKSDYEKMANNISDNTGGCIKFPGKIPHNELPKFYSKLDFLIFPSVVETQGLVALESMACGTPVIAANAMALKETIIDGKTGYLYEPGNVNDLFMKLQRAYEGKNREILTENCVNEAKKHAVENTVKALKKIYEYLVSEKV